MLEFNIVICMINRAEFSMSVHNIKFLQISGNKDTEKHAALVAGCGGPEQLTAYQIKFLLSRRFPLVACTVWGKSSAEES